MAKTGRPKVEIDWDKFEKLCRFPMTQEEIAWLLDVSVDTLDRQVPKQFSCSFAEFQRKKRATLKELLHNKQLEVALSGSVPLLIWLGKQHLEQSDKLDTKEKSEVTLVEGDKYKFLEPKD